MFKKQIQNPVRNHHKVLLLVVSVALISVAVVAFFINTRSETQTIASTNAAAPTVQSMFTFDATKALGWRKGPTNKTSMALFTSDRSCFASVEYRLGKVNVQEEVQRTQLSLAKNGNASNQSAVISQDLRSKDSSIKYDLYQYSVKSPSNENKLYGGQEFGYAQLTDGYVFVQGNCNTADQLTTTLPALQALELVKSE